jgi:hypothetical protein
MSFSEQVRQRTQQIEALLAELGGTGERIYERASHIVPPLEGRLISRLLLIAAVRDRLANDEEYIYPHAEEQFLAGCEDTISQLTNILERRRSGAPEPVDFSKSLSHARFGRLLLLIIATSAVVFALVFFGFKSLPVPVVVEKKSPPVVVATPVPSATPELKFASVAEAKAEAVRQYPELGIAGSEFNLAFLERYQIYRMQKPEYFQDPAWPLRLAEEISKTAQRR